MSCDIHCEEYQPFYREGQVRALHAERPKHEALSNERLEE